jgi:hypothetical protein
MELPLSGAGLNSDPEKVRQLVLPLGLAGWLALPTRRARAPLACGQRTNAPNSKNTRSNDGAEESRKEFSVGVLRGSHRGANYKTRLMHFNKQTQNDKLQVTLNAPCVGKPPPK